MHGGKDGINSSNYSACVILLSLHYFLNYCSCSVLYNAIRNVLCQRDKAIVFNLLTLKFTLGQVASETKNIVSNLLTLKLNIAEILSETKP